MSTSKPICPVEGCTFSHHLLLPHLLEVHKLSPSDAQKMFGPILIASPVLMQESHATCTVERVPPDLDNLEKEFAGIAFPFYPEVPKSACLPLPHKYRVPQFGELAVDVKETCIALRRKRSIYVHSLPGSGKDALFSAWSAVTHCPADIYQINPDTDMTPWLFQRDLTKEGTAWTEGKLLKQLRDGYVTASGKRIPYMIVLSDFDRASPNQAENLRLILDSIEGRIKGPQGETYQVLPGTIIVATANTMGGADERGRCISARPMDASILERFGRRIAFHYMEWQDEVEIVKGKFPALVSAFPNMLENIGKSTMALRKAVHEAKIFGEFSHRALCTWLEAAEDILAVEGKNANNILARGFRFYADGLPDEQNRTAVKREIKAHISGINV